jgi:glycosyltransferase involved in cell wall biosynthesis
MITTFYPPYNFGGDGIFVQRLSNELAQRGHQVDVIHCIDAYRLLSRRNPAKTVQDHPNVTVHGLKSRFGFLSPLATQQTGYPLFKSSRIKQILQKGFDVIHYHNVSLVGGPKILEYGQGLKLYTIHEYWLICPSHVLFKFNRAVCTQPHCFTCMLAYRRPPQLWRYLGLLQKKIKHVDMFIAPSRFCKDLHRRRGFNTPIVHIPHFVSSTENNALNFAPPISASLDTPFFLFVGRLEKLKGVQTLIPVFHRYRKANLLIVGSGSYETHLRKLARDCPNIQFVGSRFGRQLQDLYRQALAVVVPTLTLESFGQVLIEAFRQKTPAIVRDLGAMPEIIAESGGGFVYNSDNELEAALDRILANPLTRAKMGTSGFQVYREKWTTETHLKKYFELIDAEVSAKEFRKN